MRGRTLLPARLWAGAFLLLLPACRQEAGFRPPPSPATSPSPQDTSFPLRGAVAAEVTRVIDGDTIEASIDGSLRRVRYIGIDTPERIECYFQEATMRNAALVEGKSVRLERDVSETDRYGRLLRYVYVGDLFVNAELVREGYAAAATVPPDVRHADLFRRLAREAREAERGLWNPKVCPDETPAPAPAGGGGSIAIGEIHYDAAGNDHQNLGDEWVEIQNRGPSDADLTGWTLSDAAAHVYRFPAGFVLRAGRGVRVRTGAGEDTETDLHWRSPSAIWNNDGDTATLRDAAGAVAAESRY